MSADTPAAFIERARLAMDPARFIQVFNVRQALASWLEAPIGSGTLRHVTVSRVLTRDLDTAEPRCFAWRVSLFEGGELIASDTRIDHDDALAHALSHVRGERP